MRATGSREEPARDRRISRKSTTLRWRADRGDVEDDRTEYAARLSRTQHIPRRPRTATPPDRGIDATQKVAHECAPCIVPALQWPGTQEPSRLRADWKGPDVDEVERKRWQRQWREVTADRASCARTRREGLE